MVTNINYRKRLEPAEHKCLVAGPIDTGDFVKWDTTNLYIVRQATGAAVECVGVSADTIPLPSRIDSSDVVDRATVLGGDGKGIFKFKTTAAETLKHGLWVEVGADSGTVKLTSTAANRVGRIWLPDGTTVTGAAGTDIEVLVIPQYFGNNL